MITINFVIFELDTLELFLTRSKVFPRARVVSDWVFLSSNASLIKLQTYLIAVIITLRTAVTPHIGWYATETSPVCILCNSPNIPITLTPEYIRAATRWKKPRGWVFGHLKQHMRIFAQIKTKGDLLWLELWPFDLLSIFLIEDKQNICKGWIVINWF